MDDDYAAPVNKLLTLGDPRDERRWRAYGALGLEAAHIPALIRLLQDEALNDADSDSAEVWGPLHAWRALGQLRAEAAVGPLLGMLERIDERDDDWVAEEVPTVLGMLGPAALRPAADYLADEQHGLYARVAAAQALSEIAKQHPAARGEAVAAITHELERADTTPPNTELNGFLVADLLDLKAVEAAPVIERVYAAGAVDEFVTGDWEEAQFALGLIDESEHPGTAGILDMLVGPPRPPASQPPAPRTPKGPFVPRAERRAAERAQAAAKPKRKRRRSKKK